MKPKTTEKRVRIFSLMSYLGEPEITQIITQFPDIEQYAYIFHNQDDAEPHYHIMLKTANNHTPSAILSKFKIDERNTFIEVLRSIPAIIQYFIHKHEPNKHQYEISEIKANFDLSEALVTSGTTGNKIDFLEMVNWAIENQATPFQMLERYNGAYTKHKATIDQLIKDRVQELAEKMPSQQVEVFYIFGRTGCGKTRYAEEFPDKYFVTDYEHPFDRYHQQETIIFDEFRNSLKMTDMLIYTDRYARQLPARFFNNVKAWKKCLILSNWPYTAQYENVYKADKAALTRRITHIWFMTNVTGEPYFVELDENGIIKDYPKGIKYDERAITDYYDFMDDFNYKLAQKSKA